MTNNTAYTRFTWIVLGMIFLVILAGGTVRMTQSGMGCPDWPKCFGRWIPPTSESQLPSDYQERWADRGYHSTRFNAVKTWIEYGNRTIAAVIGMLVTVTLILAIAFRRNDRPLVWWCFDALLLVGFNAWLGSVVVSSNLKPWIITAHMVAA